MFSFKTAYFGTMALLQDAHINMPFQSWELRPHKLNSAVLTIIAAIIEIEIEIKVYINVWTERMNWCQMARQMRERALRQPLHVRIAKDTQKIKSSDWPKWRYALLHYVISCILLDQTSFQMVQQMGCPYTNYQPTV